MVDSMHEVFISTSCIGAAYMPNGETMFSLATLVTGAYWTCHNMHDAFKSAVNVSRGTYDIVTVTNEYNGRTVYVVNGEVSVFVKNGKEFDRWHR